MKINNLKQIDKGSVICKFNLEFEEWGLTIRDCALLTGPHGKWVSMPARQYEDKESGQKKYYNLVAFDKEVKKRLDEQVIARLQQDSTSSAFEPKPPETNLF